MRAQDKNRPSLYYMFKEPLFCQNCATCELLCTEISLRDRPTSASEIQLYLSEGAVPRTA